MRSYDPRAAGALCDLCPLNKEPVVPPEGFKTRLKVVLVGEAPGRHESNEGRPFIGRTGKFLDSLLKEAGIQRETAILQNAALCRGERDEDNAVAAECCAPRLLAELARTPKKIPIVALGGLAAKSILGVRSILVARGFVFTAKPIDAAVLRSAARAAAKADAPRSAVVRAAMLPQRALLAGRWVLPTLHPAFVLRSDVWKPVLQADIRRARKLVDRTYKDASVGPVEVLPTSTSLRRLRNLGSMVALDLETDGLSPLECKIRTVQLSDGESTYVVFPWTSSMAKPLRSFLQSRKEVVCHNGRGFDEIVLWSHGVRGDGINFQDSLIAHHTYASHLRQGLDHCVSVYLDSRPWKIEHGKRGGAEEKGGAAVASMTLEELVAYGGADALLTAKLWKAMAPDVAQERTVYQHDLALAAITRDMQIAGIGFDADRRAELSAALRKEHASLEQKMRDLIRNRHFNPRAHRQVRKALFSTLRAPRLYKTPTGLEATGALTLQALSSLETRAGIFAGLLLRWREVEAIVGKYVDKIPINPSTNRFHPSWKLGPVSGRLACRLQSTPRWDPSDPVARAREIYIPKKGNIFVYFDVSQAEMRLAAYLSADPVFVEACKGDIHANNAKKCFLEVAAKGWLDGDAKKDPLRGKPFRDLAKNVGFAISYLAETEKVFATIKAKPEGKNVTYRVVDNMLAALRRAYRVYFQWVEKNIAFCRANGYLRSPFVGRVRYLGWYPKITDVANYPIQSGLADVVNLRTIALSKRLDATIDLVAQVHDSVIYDCPKQHAAGLQREIASLWAEPLKTAGGALVLPIEMKVGERWSEL